MGLGEGRTRHGRKMGALDLTGTRTESVGEVTLGAFHSPRDFESPRAGPLSRISAMGSNYVINLRVP